MITTRFPRTYKVAKSSPYGPFPPIGGLYPDALPDDHFFERLGGSGWAEELSGLQPSGFVQGSRFETSNFDLDRVREVYETIVRYFRVIDGFDCESDLDSVLPLVNKLHSSEESITKGRLLPGELILAMWMADVPFQHFAAAGGGIIFAVDWDEIRDPWLYVDERHGYENLLRPSSVKAVA